MINRLHILFFVSSLLFVKLAVGQTGNDIVADNIKFQENLNHEYADSTKSPLSREDREAFSGLPFFPIDTNYRVVAKLVRPKRSRSVEMKTTTDRLPVYEIYGTATFRLSGKEFKLNVYQSHKLRETEAYRDHLFLPFTDLSNGDESYGGGRFIDLRIPDGDTIIIDFNQAYNPYCAYRYGYSCPIPPKENFLETKVLAGVKAPQ